MKLKLFIRVLLLSILFNAPSNTYAETTEKEICEKFKTELKTKMLEYDISFKSEKNKSKSLDDIKTDSSLDAMMKDINGVFSQTTTFHGMPLKKVDGKKDPQFDKFLEWLNSAYKTYKNEIDTGTQNVRKSEGNINPPPTPPTSRPTIESRLDSISNGIKSINEEPIFDILNWTELGLIVSLLMGLFGIIYSGFQVSLLKEKISKSEERPANTSGNSFDLARNPNQRIDNIESKFNKHEEGLLNLQNRMNQLEREPPRTNNANTFQNPQTSVQQFSLHLPPFFISCRGGVEGTLLNVSPNSDNNSIFQINPSNEEIIVMAVEAQYPYDVVINGIDNFWSILKPIGEPQKPKKGMKIITHKAGKVKQISESQWQIVDKQLIEVKFV